MEYINITPVVQAVLLLLATIITAFIVPYLKKKYGNETIDQIKRYASIAVEAAEQIYVGSGRGEEKKKHVLGFLQSMGYTVDLDIIDKIIESAVYKLNKEENTVDKEISNK